MMTQIITADNATGATMTQSNAGGLEDVVVPTVLATMARSRWARMSNGLADGEPAGGEDMATAP